MRKASRSMDSFRLEQSILWHRLDLPGHDACGLWASYNGRRLAGTAVFRSEEQPCYLSYIVECDRKWRTRSASVTGWLGRKVVKFDIKAASGGRWFMNGKEQSAELAGLIDFDLGFTPATNLIQLRRLALEIGQEAEAPVAYLDFPALALGRLHQFYLRTSLKEYEYRAPAFNYTAVFQVSEFGFVTSYPGLWEIEALQ